ncbi:Por secretion system C-terminal sorting domain-containing protein [Reichenbachiella agariperforans]|uniref:Por secretion system C-terminal sorting domain-containing protein n=1 Tax=Reichenbachiella agariperforans TaxID=156994 RepID=A0A1M6N730_REIAG|nr:T9SS type A sorting domain-containing protein [Reichenbachiella agariperforans]SHJ91491.1 Por secretion system C-terminal sorting domain-containing protein [Reichenbachiella agariperforans]
MKLQLRSIITLLLILLHGTALAQSVARQWNELLLESIRNDQARPTVHARNLFHISAAMYDAWAAYETSASTYFLGHEHRGFYISYEGTNIPSGMTQKEAQEIALSYAAHRLITHRFKNSPAASTTLQRRYDQLLSQIDSSNPNNLEDYSTESYTTDPHDLGNYIAEQIIAHGLNDGSNEAHNYACRFYETANPAMFPDGYGTNRIADPNRWQPLSFDEFVGQSGLSEGASTPKFVGPEWGQVIPFSLDESDLNIKRRDGHEYLVYMDPGNPTYLNLAPDDTALQNYQWGFGLVAQWSSHHDPTDSVRWDISPNSIGNIPLDQLPKTLADYPGFYDFENGGDISQGYSTNPVTGLPYETQTVLRADYTRVLAEFWADGPDSETPPGHWFVLLNHVNDHPDFERKYKGEDQPMDALEWNVKSYFALGGAMHDVAVTAWGIKGYYDYIRPISAIRSMAERGQSSDASLPNYHPAGIPLIPDQVEIIAASDPINQFGNFENEIKIKAWKVPGNYYEGADETKRVDWIPATRWQPYQRPSFVTPPFAGYVSGHSTFSRAAAEILSLLTGSEYFPGGMGEFVARKDNFLVFETGPSEDLTLQWARYQDASDQCSLSRIWGGIHPPVDDIAGRRIGYRIGHQAFAFAERYFNGEIPTEEQTSSSRISYGPNPVRSSDRVLTVYFEHPDELQKTISLYDTYGNTIMTQKKDYIQSLTLRTDGLTEGVYILAIATSDYTEKVKLVIAP